MYNRHMEQEKKSVSIRFPLDVLAAIKHTAREDGRSINAEIIWIIRDYLMHRKKEENRHDDKL